MRFEKAGALVLIRKRRSRRMVDPFVRYNRAVTHRHDPIGVGGNVGFMRHQDDGQALVAIKRDQCLHDLVRGSCVEIAGRLVSQENTR